MFPIACHFILYVIEFSFISKKGVVNQIINRKSLDAFKRNLAGVKSSLSILGMHVPKET